jgi:3-methylcrotonyl-CoA carboxylase alpha subunit
MFKKVLIANRGEIAVRVAATLREMGISVVGVCSDADATALHVTACDEVYRLPGVSAGETYLQGQKIVEIARLAGAEAIHPGYGFLSENASFAKACADAGITFVGPSPAAIESMGDKIFAKETMEHAGVPVVPGWSGDVNTPVATIANEADRIGYPLLVKAAAGGGGKGMRLVRESSSLEDALAAAGREAKSAFGDARVFLEKYVAKPRHIEFQIFGDSHGHYVHLFERECSIQRRHQKIVEEAPSPAMTPELRNRMGEAAVKAAEAIDYTGAGTVEFLLDDDGRFYFLEVNTRLQVEHPVTEMTTLHDLVKAQLLVAAGEPLPFSSDTLRQHGHAVECRIYAEDPANNFLPSIGTIQVYRPPAGPNIRVDSGVAERSEVSVHYDPMLAKLIVWGKDRNVALQRMAEALKQYAILGVTTNVTFLCQIIEHPEFVAGHTNTHFLEDHQLDAGSEPVESTDALLAAALVACDVAGAGGKVTASAKSSERLAPDPWSSARAWRVGA